MTAEETLLVEKRDGVCRLTLNRPQVLNAIDFALGDKLIAALEEAGDDDTVRAIVLAGAGRAFCAGDDIKEGVAVRNTGSSMTRQGGHHNIRRVNYFRFREALRSNPKPVIARVQGYAYGAGLDLVLASDIAIAASDAKLGAVYIKHGMVGSIALLPRYVGMKKAIEMLITGEPVAAPDAERLGLINYAVPPAKLDQTVDEWAAKLAAGPTRLISGIKLAAYRGVDQPYDDALVLESVALAAARASEDQREGLAAFLERRPPNYSGR
jgi:2-(1,2-epoxy-1,2-dihydrophenyl)acetyl-CoA isomerase